MTGPLATAIIIASLVLAGWGLLTTVLNRPAGISHLIGLAVVEVALLGQVAVAIVLLARGERPAEFATFIGYLVAGPLVLPLGAALALVERSRWGSAIVTVAALVIPVLILRLQQVWHG